MRWNLLLVLAVCSLSVAGCGRDNAKSQFADGQAAYQAKDFAKAVSLFGRACQTGEPRACTSLGAMAFNGQGGRKDLSWARGLYEKACKGGDVEGCEKLRAMTAQAATPAPAAPPAATEETGTASAPDAASEPAPDAESTPDAAGVPGAAPAPEAAFVPTAHPNFDCATARNEAERLICTDDDLARRDVELARLYRRARDHAVDEDVVITEQRDWIALRRNACTSKECLVRAYRHRARELEDWIP